MAPKVVGDKIEQGKTLNIKRTKKRGPYKKYNFFGSTAEIPAKTQYRWRLKARVQQ